MPHQGFGAHPLGAGYRKEGFSPLDDMNPLFPKKYRGCYDQRRYAKKNAQNTDSDTHILSYR
jgi:hypothetical protein